MGFYDDLVAAAQGNSGPLTSAPPAAPQDDTLPPSGNQQGQPNSGLAAALSGRKFSAPSAPSPAAGAVGGSIKGYLSNIFYNMGETAKSKLGMPTEQEEQDAANNQQTLANAQNQTAQMVQGVAGAAAANQMAQAGRNIAANMQALPADSPIKTDPLFEQLRNFAIATGQADSQNARQNVVDTITQSMIGSPVQQIPQLRQSKLRNFLSGIREGVLQGAGLPTDLQRQQAQAQINASNANANEASQRGQYYQNAANQFNMVQVGTNPDGSPVYVQQKDVGAYQKQGLANQGRYQVAQLQAMAKQAQQQVTSGQVKEFLPWRDPQTGEVGKMAMDKSGNPIRFYPDAVITQLIQTTSNTTDFIADNDGKIHAIPKTTVRTPTLPGQPGQGAQPGQVQGGRMALPRTSGPMPVVDVTTGKVTPESLNAMAAAKSANKPANRSIPQSGVSIVNGTVYVNGAPLFGKGGGDTGYAYDPKTNENVLTTRMDASQNGYQNFNKAGAKQVADDTRLNNQLGDVALKVTRYSDAMGSIPADDQNKIAYLLNSDKFKLGAFGAEIPVDEINTFLAQHQLGSLSPQGVRAYNSYLQAREALVGYNRVLSGSSRSNEKQLELLLKALPSPTQPMNVVRDGISQFVENIHTAGNGLPRIPGVKSWRDYLQPNVSVGGNGNGNAGGGGKYLPWFTPVQR